MSEEQKNAQIEESDKESNTPEQSKTNEPVKPEPQSTPEDDKESLSSNSENEKKALQGIISAKDKKMSEFEKQQAEIVAELNRMKIQAELSKKLLKEDIPDEIKDALSDMVESGEVDLDTFESKRDKLSKIFNAGLESQKRQVSDLINKKVERVVPKDFDQKMKEIDPKDPDALEKIKALNELL